MAGSVLGRQKRTLSLLSSPQQKSTKIKIRMESNELTGLAAAILAAFFFGSYGVPMKGEAATKVDVDPLVFQSYKAFTVCTTSVVLILLNNKLASTNEGNGFKPWTLADFTPWAFVSASLWVPGGTAGVYAIRRTGLAISVGIWSCVIVFLSFVWGVLIFHEKQRSGIWGAMKALTVLCVGLVGIAYFSSFEAEGKRKHKHADGDVKQLEQESVVVETTPLLEMLDQLVEAEDEEISLDLETYPHSGAPPHSHKTIHIDPPAFLCTDGKSKEHALDIQQYNIGIFMAVLNGVLAATIMVPLHYAPPNATRGIGFSMSFGIAAVLVVMALWVLRWLFYSAILLHRESRQDQTALSKGNMFLSSMHKGYRCLPSFHWRVMWRPGLLSGLLYSLGNLMGIISIQRLGNFMGYSLNQSSMIVSGLWGIFYYKEIAGTMHMLGFLFSVCIVFVGILLLGREHV